MRRTKESHLLLEVRGENAITEIGILRDDIAEKVGDCVGGVVKLGSQAVAEILDLDPTVDKGEIQAALQNAIMSQSDDSVSTADAESVAIIGLWTIKAGMQIATVKMSAKVLARLNSIGRITVG